MNKPELLAPAGDLEKLKMAVIYGADAVYFGDDSYGLRSASKNFTREEMSEGVNFCHENNVKAYATLNISLRDKHFNGMEEYLLFLSSIKIDAVIVSDLGLVKFIRDNFSELDIHISTQANTTNSHTVNFFGELGVTRVVLAREITLKEIKEIISNSNSVEIEAFIHGAMCISYSGRCLLSSYMTGRHSNLGDCAQPCRWKYALVEEKRENEYFPIEEDEKGTYIMNSKDLCMIKNIDELAAAGIKSFKIEGRMKSSYYTATVVRSYRKAIDDSAVNKKFDEYWYHEIKKASHRDYTTGFYYGDPAEEGQLYTSSSYIREYDFIGLVMSYDLKTQIAVIQQRNKFSSGDIIEIFGPDIKHFEYTIENMYNMDNEIIVSAPHPQQLVKIEIIRELKSWYILRKKNIE